MPLTVFGTGFFYLIALSVGTLRSFSWEHLPGEGPFLFTEKKGGRHEDQRRAPGAADHEIICYFECEPLCPVYKFDNLLCLASYLM